MTRVPNRTLSGLSVLLGAVAIFLSCNTTPAVPVAAASQDSGVVSTDPESPSTSETTPVVQTPDTGARKRNYAVLDGPPLSPKTVEEATSMCVYVVSGTITEVEPATTTILDPMYRPDVFYLYEAVRASFLPDGSIARTVAEPSGNNGNFAVNPSGIKEIASYKGPTDLVDNAKNPSPNWGIGPDYLELLTDPPVLLKAGQRVVAFVARLNDPGLDVDSKGSKPSYPIVWLLPYDGSSVDAESLGGGQKTTADFDALVTNVFAEMKAELDKVRATDTAPSADDE